MFHKSYGAVLTVLVGVVHGIAFNGPRATQVVRRFDPNGWTPKPTARAEPLLEMFKRQDDPSFCGYLEGDPDAPLSCSAGRSCMYDVSFSWFGCCTGSVVTDCDVVTACVESASLSACAQQSSCANDLLLTACTDASEPYCLGLYTVVSSETYGHFECAATDTTLEVLPTTTGSGGSVALSLTKTQPLLTNGQPTRTSLGQFTLNPSSSASGDDQSSSSKAASSSGASSASSKVASVTPAAAPTTSAVSSAKAVRTAEAVVGALGGVAAGVFAVLF